MLSEGHARWVQQRVFVRYMAEYWQCRWHAFTHFEILNCDRLAVRTCNCLLAMSGVKLKQSRQKVFGGHTIEATADHIIRSWGRYISILEQNKTYSSRIPRPNEVKSSTLLTWLLQGREPLPRAPPYLYGAGRHQLATGESALEIDVWENLQPDGKHRLVVGQNDKDFDWILPHSLIVHLPTKHVYRLMNNKLQRVCRRSFVAG